LTAAYPCAIAQSATSKEYPGLDTVIEAAPEQTSDEKIQERIKKIFSQITALKDVRVSVREGVVRLSGAASNDAQAERALELATRVVGVVTVEDDIERTLKIEENLTPVIDQFKSDVNRWTRALPLLILSATAFLLIAFAGHLLAGWTTLWRRLSPNSFLAELIAHAVRIVTIAFGLVVALNLMGATALMGTILGGAGVFGLAIGFALRDSLENYISSIMLSLRQPFRANDHVVIDDHEGIVVRLTTRATVLMTLDGNHLRIPNSNVFKGIILNYTRNPERRFEFDLGVDAEDDPVAAMKTGLDAIRDLDFVLADPKPDANIETVGDSNIVVKFLAWVNQNQTDFRKARSLAIRAAKNALEENGFTLPEPIYRLRFDESFSSATGENLGVSRTNASREASQGEKTKILPDISDTDELLDVRPDLHLEEKVNEEREQDSGTDLLDNSKPVE
jgi:small-conductance mechanosensitive channel